MLESSWSVACAQPWEARGENATDRRHLNLVMAVSYLVLSACIVLVTIVLRFKYGVYIR